MNIIKQTKQHTMPALNRGLFGGLGAVLLAVWLLSWGEAQATIPDANGVYYACYKKSGKEIKIIDNAVTTTCKSGETLISWNQQGIAGINGTNGTNGTNGIDGNGLPSLPAERFQATLMLCGNSDTPQWGPCLYAVGDTGPAGGKVFQVTDGGLHGLEAAPQDQSSDAEWGCPDTGVTDTAITGADGTAVGTGAQNTADILAGCNEAGIAARLVDEYSLNGYTDWFLPSRDELNLLFLQQAVVGGLANGFYWTSTEFLFEDTVYFQNFGNGHQGVSPKLNTLRVRAVRDF